MPTRSPVRVRQLEVVTRRILIWPAASVVIKEEDAPSVAITCRFDEAVLFEPRPVLRNDAGCARRCTDVERTRPDRRVLGGVPGFCGGYSVDKQIEVKCVFASGAHKG